MIDVIGYIKQIDAPWVMEIIAERFDYQAIEMMTDNVIIYGGAVRDALAGFPLVGDLDMAVINAERNNLFQQFQKSVKWTNIPRASSTLEGKLEDHGKVHFASEKLSAPRHDANLDGDLPELSAHIDDGEIVINTTISTNPPEWQEDTENTENTGAENTEPEQTSREEGDRPHHNSLFELANRYVEMPSSIEDCRCNEDGEPISAATREDTHPSDREGIDLPVTEAEARTSGELTTGVVKTVEVDETTFAETIAEPMNFCSAGNGSDPMSADQAFPEDEDPPDDIIETITTSDGVMCSVQPRTHHPTDEDGRTPSAAEPEPIFYPRHPEESHEAYGARVRRLRRRDHEAGLHPTTHAVKEVKHNVKNYKESTLPLSEIYTFSDVNNAVIQIMVAESLSIRDPRRREEISPINHVIHLVRSVDLICCGVIMNNKGEVFEVIEGAYDDCKNRILRFNDKLENGVSAERVVERVNRLKKRGWTNKVDFAEIEELVKRSERAEIAKKAKMAKKAKSKSDRLSKSGKKWCDEEKRIRGGWKANIRAPVTISDRNSKSGGMSPARAIDPAVINLLPGQFHQATSSEEAQNIFEAAESGNPGQHTIEIYNSVITGRKTFRVRRKSANRPTMKKLDEAIERLKTGRWSRHERRS